MEFGTQHRTQPGESIVPMINVVFLLLIFFLMTAQIAPPEPFPVDPPEAEGGAVSEGLSVLHVGSDGRLAYGGAEGEAALAALAGHQGALEIRASADLDAALLTALLPRLAERGLTDVRLVTARR